MNANYSITALFVQQVTLATAGTGGTEGGAGTYNLGSTVPITASPSPATYSSAGPAAA